MQRLLARVPGLRRLVRREGAALFDVVSGFVQTQCLRALVELRIPWLLMDKALDAATVAARCDLPERQATILLDAGVALRLLDRRGNLYRTAQRGAALTGVPGLADMITHHDVLYLDLADPVAFFRGRTDPDLARFWPYVFGGGDAAAAARYSRLMADSQTLVAEDTLAAISLGGVPHLLDVGGGSGTFARAALAATPGLRVTVFDLPGTAGAPSPRLDFATGSFRDDPLPRADAISLIRVLYDHDDATVRTLLEQVYAALPPGGRLVVSEPMKGEAAPHLAGDVYFATYCLAMGTGTARTPSRIAGLMRKAGFARIRRHPSRRPFVTSVVEARRESV